MAKTVKQYLAYVDRLTVATKIEVEDKMQFRCAVRYRDRVIGNLVSQKFAWAFPDLDEKYQQSKANNGGDRGFWRFSDDLLNNLTAFSIKIKGKTAWVGGIIPMTTNTKGEDITEYGLVAEYGRRDGNPPKERPLFGLTADEFAKVEWKKEGSLTLKRISKRW